MWKIKNKEAVSPVIGVILMVAITVVLAAVLYVWVSGFMGGGGAMTPTGALTGTRGTGGATYNVTNVSVVSLSPATPPSKIKWYILDTGDISVESGILTIATSSPTTGTTVVLRDNDADTKVSTGDVIQIGENGVLQSGYKLRLAYIDTAGTIATLTFV